MKRTLIALVWVMLSSLAMSPSMAQDSGRSGDGIKHYPKGFYSTTESEARQRFLDDTVDLRRSLVVKQAEFNALQAQTNADPKLAGKLAKEIFDIQEELRVKAKEYEIKGEGKPPDKDEQPADSTRRGWYCW